MKSSLPENVKTFLLSSVLLVFGVPVMLTVAFPGADEAREKTFQ